MYKVQLPTIFGRLKENLLQEIQSRPHLQWIETVGTADAYEAGFARSEYRMRNPAKLLGG